ncbi:transporter [Pontibacter ruber]|uniref:Transporter n=1 Tax=Pontibacter ruber TaxID=1343895 RepID=A0ABW5CX89_9BACT|nr:transporter [Pontibacter ruber]
MNAVAVGYAISTGSVVVDAALPVEDIEVTAHSIAARYVRTFGVAQKLARINVVVPYVTMEGQAKVIGQDTSTTRTGFGDARVQVGINLIGSPALDRKEFNKYSQKTIVGISLITSMPTGLYYKDKRVNLGNNRWGFKPEIGASKKFKRIYADGYVGMWFYAKNKDYLVSKVKKQEPLLSTQLHLSYYFKNQMMVGLNGNWFSGGKTFINDVALIGPFEHMRAGATWAVPLSGKHLFKLQFHTSVYTNTGLNFDSLAFGYQYVFF